MSTTANWPLVAPATGLDHCMEELQASNRGIHEKLPGPSESPPIFHKGDKKQAALRSKSDNMERTDHTSFMAEPVSSYHLFPPFGC